MYSLGTVFVSGIYVQIPCIKEIMMMIVIIQKYSACKRKEIPVIIVDSYNKNN
jgi:hypothetical protein